MRNLTDKSTKNYKTSTPVEEKRCKAKVFLEGVEIKFQSIQVSATKDSPPTASIVVAPHRTLQRIIDRTLVHIFVLDDRFSGEADTFNPDSWSLLFNGEVTGWSYNKTSRGRKMNVYAQGIQKYFGERKVYQENYKDALFNMSDHQKEVKSGNAVVKSGLYTGNFLASKVLTSELGFFESILASLEKTMDSNIFFQERNDKLFLTNSSLIERIKFFDDDAYNDLFFRNELMEILKGTASKTSQVGTFFNFLDDMAKKVKYHITFDYNGFSHMYLKPINFFNPPPSCNVIFPNQITSLSFNRDFRREYTRTVFSTRDSIYFPESDSYFSNVRHVAPKMNFATFESIEQSLEYKEKYEKILKDKVKTKNILDGLKTSKQKRKGKLKKFLENARKNNEAFNNKKEVSEEAKKKENIKYKKQKEKYGKQIARLDADLKDIQAVGEDLKNKKLSPPIIAAIKNEILNTINLNEGDHLTPEESIRGINANYGVLDNELLINIDPKQVPDFPEKKYMFPGKDYNLYERLAEYNHWASKYIYRRTNVEMTFDPNITPGFPTLVLDEEAPFYGMIDSVSHVISASGQTGTKAAVSFVRPADECDGLDKLNKMGGFFEQIGISFPTFINPMVYKYKLTEVYNYFLAGISYNKKQYLKKFPIFDISDMNLINEYASPTTIEFIKNEMETHKKKIELYYKDKDDVFERIKVETEIENLGKTGHVFDGKTLYYFDGGRILADSLIFAYRENNKPENRKRFVDNFKRKGIPTFRQLFDFHNDVTVDHFSRNLERDEYQLYDFYFFRRHKIFNDLKSKIYLENLSATEALNEQNKSIKEFVDILIKILVPFEVGINYANYYEGKDAFKSNNGFINFLMTLLEAIRSKTRTSDMEFAKSFYSNELVTEIDKVPSKLDSLSGRLTKIQINKFKDRIKNIKNNINSKPETQFAKEFKPIDGTADWTGYNFSSGNINELYSIFSDMYYTILSLINPKQKVIDEYNKAINNIFIGKQDNYLR